jgi:hypothetical protein
MVAPVLGQGVLKCPGRRLGVLPRRDDRPSKVNAAIIDAVALGNLAGRGQSGGANILPIVLMGVGAHISMSQSAAQVNGVHQGLL